MQEYVQNSILRCQDTSDEAYQVVANIEDMQDEWDKAEQDIQNAINEKAMQEGIAKQLAYEFQVFEIEDMYNDIRSGTICYKCKSNKNCEKHKFER